MLLHFHREIGQVTSSDSSYEVSVHTTFSLYKLKDIVVAIYQKVDGNKNGDTTQQQHLLGYSRFGLHRLVRTREETHCTLENGGQIFVLATPTDTKCKNLRFRFAAGKGLGASTSLGVQTSDTFERNPFLAVSYLREEPGVDDKGTAKDGDKKKGKWEVLWKSNVVRGTSNTQFHFNYGQIPTYRLNGDTPVCITCLDYDDKVRRGCIINCCLLMKRLWYCIFSLILTLSPYNRINTTPSSARPEPPITSCCAQRALRCDTIK